LKSRRKKKIRGDEERKDKRERQKKGKSEF
jgi:hypothetical protein